MTAGLRRAGAALGRSAAADAALVLVALVLVLGNDRWGDERGSFGPAALVDAALFLPLLVRRRWPSAVFVAVAAVAFVQWAADIRASGDFAVLAALYAVGAYERRRVAVAAAAGIAQVGVVLATVRWAPPGHGLGAAVLLTGTMTAAWVLGVTMRTRRAYVASVLDRAVTAERERDSRALLAAAAERARISREMHDIVAHSLSVMIALSDGAGAAVAKSPLDAQQAMAQASTVGRQALGEVRRLLDVHRESPGIGEPQDAPQPGIDEVAALVDQVRAAGLPVDLVVLGERPELPASAELTAYRLVQEGLTNVLKHAPGASRAVVTLRHAPGRLDIEVENDEPPVRSRAVTGDGGVVAAEGGRGLAGMRERAAVFGGTVDAAARAGGGWRVSGTLRLDGPVT